MDTMSRIKLAVTPYVSDAVAFALLGIATAIVIWAAIVNMPTTAEQARHYESGVSVSL